MRLNVLGTKLLPLGNDRMADENLPLCAEMGDAFANWLLRSGDLHAVSPADPSGRVLLSAETWVQSYQDNSHPILIAEFSHERSLYWVPLDMFIKAFNHEETPTNGDGEWEIT